MYMYRQFESLKLSWSRPTRALGDQINMGLNPSGESFDFRYEGNKYFVYTLPCYMQVK